MTVHYLKRATSTSSSGDASVRDTVAGLLAALEAGREEEAKRQAADYDHWAGGIVVSPDAIGAARATRSEERRVGEGCRLRGAADP